MICCTVTESDNIMPLSRPRASYTQYRKSHITVRSPQKRRKFSQLCVSDRETCTCSFFI